jgi:hypothetical protein
MKTPKQLSNEEREAFKVKIRQLRNYPGSQRIFQELFNQALETLEKYGRKRNLYQKAIDFFSGIKNAFSKRLEYTDPFSKGFVSMSYSREKDSDRISLFYEDGRKLGLSLIREKGNLTAKQILSLDSIEMIMKGITLNELKAGLKTYEPHSLRSYEFGRLGEEVLAKYR